ncbi:MAG: hypothetical protein IJ711_10530 [Lachnospiraceae bacterium]|nr:hypothetical protein [Lachnospiraceae bacterium]
MRISFEQIGNQQNMDNGSRILHSTPSETGKIYNRMGYKIDISGTALDNNAYGGQGKTAEDVMQEASQRNVQTERNYMVVMSNSMSAKDFAKLQEDGYQVGHTDVETIVSIVDKIKATMAQSGQIIVGYTDDLSMEELTQITGDISLAVSISKSFEEHNIPATEENVRGAVTAFQKAMQMPDITDGALKYMVMNQQQPTIENIYLAGYKSFADDKTQAMGYFADDLAGYYGKKADDMDAGKLTAQMEKIIEEAGLTVSDETLNEAKWLVENGAMLTADSMRLLHDIRQLTFPVGPEQALDAIAVSIAEGRKPENASLTEHTDLYHRAAELTGEVATVTDDAVYQVIEKEEKLSLRNMIRNQKMLDARTAQDASKREAGPNNAAPLSDDTQRRFARAKRQLEEVRLRMTAETNIRLLKRGFSIDTAPLQEVVDRLRAAEEAEGRTVFAADSPQEARQRKQLYEETLQKTGEIRQMPIDTVGRYAFLQRRVTLQDIHTRGQALRQEYAQAGRAYETMMTAPRSDLGDSISKAFRNVDFLLEDMGLEVCEANSRAVRILAYNQMPVNKESVAIIKNADLSLQRVVDKLTPANTLYMVRDGVNPLGMSLEELYDYLNQIPQTKEEATEKFGKFIYKLDKKKEITQEEKEACIGVFRLIRQVEKGDFQALGAVVDADQSLSLMNLLTAVRTRAGGHVNRVVDDTFAGMQSTAGEENLITQQIGSYYEKRIERIYERLEPEKLLAMSIGDTTTVEELADAMDSHDIDEELERAYQAESLQTIRQAAKVSDEAIGAVLEGKVTMSADYLLAADYLRSYRGMTMRRIGSYARAVDEMTNRITTKEEPFEEQLENAVRDLHENLESREQTEKSYRRLLDISASILTEASMLTRPGTADMQSMIMYMKQLQFLGDMSREENYEIPLTVGDEVTSLNLKIVHNKGEAGQVSISLQTMELSNVTAHFRIGKDEVRGVITSSSRSGLSQLKENQEQLAGSIRKQLGKEVSIQYVHTGRQEFKAPAMRRETDEDVGTNDLYILAKSFIRTMNQG